MNPEIYYDKLIKPCGKCGGHEQHHNKDGFCLEEEPEHINTLRGRIRGVLQVFQWGWITEEQLINRMNELDREIERSLNTEAPLAF